MFRCGCGSVATVTLCASSSEKNWPNHTPLTVNGPSHTHTHGAIDKTFRPPFCVAKGGGLEKLL